MNDPAVLFVKPAAISTEDKAALREAGIIVVEIDDPSAVNFVRAQTLPPEVPAAAILRAASKAMLTPGGSYASSVTEAFGKNVAAAIAETKPS